jgi:hypothetical protein
MENGEENKKAFLLAGHRNWGKSRTLNDPSFVGKKLHITIKDKKIVIIKSSNGDKRAELLEVIKKHLGKPYIIIAFCADFDKGFFTVEILTLLQNNGYDIFSFVLKHKYNDPNIQVTDEEITKLKQYSKVEIYGEKKAEAAARAAEFKKYIEKNMP